MRTPSEVLAKAGSRVEVRCHVSGSPVALVSWQRRAGESQDQATNFSRSPSEALLVLEQAMAGDSGWYECTAAHLDYRTHVCDVNVVIGT